VKEEGQMKNELKYSIVIPAYNEEKNLSKTVGDLQEILHREKIPYEIILVDDNSTDGTRGIIEKLVQSDNSIVLVERTTPGGFGRAVKIGIEAVSGDAVVICMADSSDDPEDVIAYYRKLEEGYDCVFGSRFIKGARIENYPKLKLVVNRVVNRCIQLLFWCKFNDLTNAFKAYRTDVVHACGPYHGCHFNITIEMSLGALIRKYDIAQIPINWYGRTWGSSNLSMHVMGRRYLATLLKAFAEKLLITDDLIAEKLSQRSSHEGSNNDVEKRLTKLEQKYRELEGSIKN
jgi:dolichol-phosphate mannosyltransferase